METGVTIANNQIANVSKTSTIQLIECLVKNDVSGLIEIEGDLTISSAMEGTSLGKLSAQIEKKNVVKVITYLTSRLADNFNVGKKFSIEQASIMALDLLEVFNYETIEDVVLMFRYARQGKIGDGKDFKLDSQTVFHKWVPEYLELKAIERENQHNKKKGDLHVNNFKWNPQDIKNFEVSDKHETITTIPNGLGKRAKADYGTDGYEVSENDFVSNKQRKEYLQKLASEASKETIERLNNALKYFTEKGNEPDAVEVIQKEIGSRK